MTDTLSNMPRFDAEAERRNMLLDQGVIVDISKTGKRAGLKCKAAVTTALFNHIHPYAEDATKGVSFEELMYDIVNLFEKEYKRSGESYAEFDIITKTYVKKYHSPEKIETFADGKPRDKRLTIFVTWMPDDKKKPSLVFGCKDFQFVGGE